MFTVGRKEDINVTLTKINANLLSVSIQLTACIENGSFSLGHSWRHDEVEYTHGYPLYQ